MSWDNDDLRAVRAGKWLLICLLAIGANIGLLVLLWVLSLVGG